MGGTLTIIFVLGIIWGIWSIIAGIIFILGGGFLAFLIPAGGVIYIVIGILSFLTGLFAILSCMRIHKRENYEQARLYCLIGSIIALVTGGLIIGVIGLIFWFLLKDQKNRFKS